MSTETTYNLLEMGGEEGTYEQLVPSAPTCEARRDCQQPPEQQMLRWWGHQQCKATCVLSDLLFQQLCRTESQKQSADNQLLKAGAKDGPTHYESPAAPPPSSDCCLALNILTD